MILGCANQAGEDNRNVARMGAMLAGLPASVPGLTVNRLCGSGLDAVALAARQVRAGEADIVIAGGVESMSRAPFVMGKAEEAFSRKAEIFDTTIGWRFVNPRMLAAHGTDSMPETAENVAAEHGVSRADQDAFAERSQARASAAQASGRLAREIVAVPVPQRRGDPVSVERDEHPRLTSLEALGSLPTPFRKGGTVTAGNASASTMARRRCWSPRARRSPVTADAARAHRRGGERRSSGPRHGDRPRAGDAEAAGPPRALARRRRPRRAQRGFAAQALAVTRALGLPDDAGHVNPNGGAIALGHPLGMSGARLALTAAIELADRGARRALCTMCVGVGQGVSLLLERD